MSSCGESPEEEPSPHHILPLSDPLFSLRHSLDTEGCPYSLELSDVDSCQVSTYSCFFLTPFAYILSLGRDY